MIENKETVYIGKDFCQYREYLYDKSWNEIRKRNNEVSKKEVGQANYCGLICPICNTDLNVGDIAYMVMNNYRLFPNTVIHKSCAGNQLVRYLRLDVLPFISSSGCLAQPSVYRWDDNSWRVI